MCLRHGAASLVEFGVLVELRQHAGHLLLDGLKAAVPLVCLRQRVSGAACGGGTAAQAISLRGKLLLRVFQLQRTFVRMAGNESPGGWRRLPVLGDLIIILPDFSDDADESSVELGDEVDDAEDGHLELLAALAASQANHAADLQWLYGMADADMLNCITFLAVCVAPLPSLRAADMAMQRSGIMPDFAQGRGAPLSPPTPVLRSTRHRAAYADQPAVPFGQRADYAPRQAGAPRTVPGSHTPQLEHLVQGIQTLHAHCSQQPQMQQARCQRHARR